MKFKKATFMYNIKHSNLSKPMKDMFEISNNEFHNFSFLRKSVFYAEELPFLNKFK